MKYRIKLHLQEHRWQYTVIVLLLLLGLIAGNYMATHLNTGVKGHLLEMIDNYLRSQQIDAVGSFEIWAGAFINQLQTVLLIWFLGLTVIGLPLILALIFVRGLSLGFTVGFLIQEKAGAGVLMTLLTIFPQNLVYIPMTVVWAVIAINFSLFLVQGRLKASVSLGRSLAIYCAWLLICSLIILAGSLIEAYLSPRLLGLLL